MKKKAKRKMTRVHTRKLDRMAAMYNMKRAGVHKPNKHFAENWRGWVYEV